jgi:hypothetical protein
MHRLFADEALKTQTKFELAQFMLQPLLQQTAQHKRSKKGDPLAQDAL